jgi:hypothetical protein
MTFLIALFSKVGQVFWPIAIILVLPWLTEVQYVYYAWVAWPTMESYIETAHICISCTYETTVTYHISEWYKIILFIGNYTEYRRNYMFSVISRIAQVQLLVDHPTQGHMWQSKTVSRIRYRFRNRFQLCYLVPRIDRTIDLPKGHSVLRLKVWVSPVAYSELYLFTWHPWIMIDLDLGKPWPLEIIRTLEKQKSWGLGV